MSEQSTPLQSIYARKAAPSSLQNQHALLMAAKEGDIKLIKKLVAQGIDVNTTSPINQYTPLHYAAYCGKITAALALVNLGANINKPDILGYTPLHWAADQGYSNLARVLLAFGADATIENKFGKTPSQIALLNDKFTTHALLKTAEHYASINQPKPPMI